MGTFSVVVYNVMDMRYKTCADFSDLFNSNINEDKRETEKQMLLFEIVKEIEDCPVSYSNTLYICIYNLLINGCNSIGQHSVL